MTPSHARPARLGIAMLLTCAGAGATARAEVPPHVAALVRLLDAPDLATRDRAQAELLDPERRPDFDAIESLITPDLSPEQRIRLTNVARTLFRNMPRGAVGIRWNANQDPRIPGLVVDQVIEGFDAHTKLRVGDRIIEMDDVQIRKPEEVRSAILAHKPGEILAMKVERDDQIIDVSVRLGDHETLQKGVMPSEVATFLDASFRLRASRWPTGPSPTIIESGLTPQQWMGSPTPSAEADAGPSRSLRIALERLNAPALVAGGRARDPVDRLDLGAGIDTWNVAIAEQLALGGADRATLDEIQRRQNQLRSIFSDANQRLVQLERARAKTTNENELRDILAERSILEALRYRLSLEQQRLEQARLASFEARVQQLDP